MRDIPSHIHRMARLWYRMESESPTSGLPPASKMQCSDILAIAVPRVEAVLLGEVRWSEASPGDRAIWVGRARNVEEVVRDLGVASKETMWENVWDTVVIGSGARGVVGVPVPTGTRRIFGNENVGNWRLSNLQCPGQLVARANWEVAQIYAECDRSPDRGEALRATLIIGNKIATSATLSDLLFGHPVGATVVECQNFMVSIDWSGIARPLELRVHLEGRATRTVG